MEWIDLRSDTVTLPTPEMREAMARAELGDDVYGEDPTINQLEAMAAERTGKQAALFVPSGTMGNLVSVLTQCGRGDEVILGNLSHTFLYEAGGVAALGGVQPHTLPNQPDGTLLLEQIEEAIRADDPHFPVSRLVALENTHNRCGGVPLTTAYVRQVGELVQKHGLRLHIDGARIFNAAAAQGVPASELVAPADSVMFCLSKGLCAPVGSMVCGDEDFIRRAHRMRKILGGGMRQAGVLAAAGIVALESMIDRLNEDHQRAKKLAQGLQKIPGVSLKMGMPSTNMVFIKLSPEAPVDERGLAEALVPQRIKLVASGSGGMRLVVHYWIDDEAIERVLGGFNQVLGGR